MTSRLSLQHRILIDLNTQRDFLLPSGALPVANRDVLLPRIRALMAWARLEGVAIISSLEAHRSGEAHRGQPAVCIDRSPGQRKVPCTMMPRRVVVQGDNTFDLPSDPFAGVQQIIFTKRHDDFLSNPKADRLINTLRPSYWILSGVAATHAVKSITLGLLARNLNVAVVRDCCGYWSANDADHAFRQMEAKGAVLVDADTVISGEIEPIMSERIAARMETEDEAALRMSAQRLKTLRHARDTDNEQDKLAKPSAGGGPTRKPKVTDLIGKKVMQNRQGPRGTQSPRRLA